MITQALSGLDEKALDKIESLGREFKQYLSTLPSSREVSLAKTKIEEAIMWAKESLIK